MVSTPVQNLSDFFKNRPPLVIFLICLVALAVSTFYYAFEIEKDGPVVNSDKEHDWIQMLKHFNKLDVCISHSVGTDEVNNIPKDKERFSNEISVSTPVTIENINVLRHLSQIQGALSLEEWHPTSCQDTDKLPKTMEISFDVPPQDALTNGSADICVTIKGPAEFLPFLKQQLCKPTKSPEIAKGFLTSKLPGRDNPNYCSDGEITKMVFDLTIPEVGNYLNDDVRLQIYVHLMWCSYFLVFVIFVILLYSILKKSDYLEKKEQNVRLL